MGIHQANHAGLKMGDIPNIAALPTFENMLITMKFWGTLSSDKAMWSW